MNALRWVLLALTLIGCSGGQNGTPRVPLGEAECAVCGMTVGDARYAAVLRESDQDSYYDAIECLVRRLRQGATGEAWLSDYEPPHALIPATSATVLLAGFPSPMGGGYAAFSDPERARALAESRKGRQGTLDEFVEGGS